MRKLPMAALRCLSLLSIPLLSVLALPPPGQAATVYWSLFNIEEESFTTSTYVTYATLDDMLNDTNRVAYFNPNTQGSGPANIESDTDGTNFWNLFNLEGESFSTATYVTYATFDDMLNDTNRLTYGNTN